jgi:hypothetical protein
VALDTYFRGNSQEAAFCNKVKAGGNHTVICTAGGRPLGAGLDLRLREKELAVVLEEYRALPLAERTGPLDDPSLARPADRPMPDPPAGALVIRGYCTYLRRAEGARFEKDRPYYYERNPDRWRTETQSDMLWLTESEWRSLIPAESRPGIRFDVPAAIQRRFFCTIAIDYMEGSVNSLPPSETTMTLTVERADETGVLMALDGYGRLGEAFAEERRHDDRSRGCEVRVTGRLHFDRSAGVFDRFDVIGIGEAWGNKGDDVDREPQLKTHPWLYGIACELVTGGRAIDRIPPYNLLHYGSAGPYFPVQPE